MDVDVERSGVAARVRSPGGQRAEGGDIWQQLVDEADEAAGPGTGGSGQAGGQEDAEISEFNSFAYWKKTDPVIIDTQDADLQ